MVGLSVAIGRFMEALFWAIFRVAGAVTVVAVGGVIGAFILYVALRRLSRRG